MTTPKTAPKRVALYARISTLDKHQDPETQLRQLREHAQHRGFAIAREFVDYASGRNNAHRPAAVAAATRASCWSPARSR